jgi:hypothetical protein
MRSMKARIWSCATLSELMVSAMVVLLEFAGLFNRFEPFGSTPQYRYPHGPPAAFAFPPKAPITRLT